MKSRAVIPLLVGLAIGVFAIRTFLQVLKKAKGSGAAETVEVVRANTDIAPTVAIVEEMLETAAVPKSMVPAGVFNDPKKLVGRVANHMIPSGMPVVPSLLSPEGTIPGLSSRVREGFRAVAVQVDEIAGVAGWLKPGCRVDVVLVANLKDTQSGKQKGSISKIILQNVELLAVGDQIKAEGAKASVTRSVTVLVTPDDATRLTLASSKGKLRLTMRSQGDFSEPRVATMTDNDLFSDPVRRKSAQQGREGPSLLSRMFTKVPKIDPNQTDKKEAVPEDVAAPVEVTSASADGEWMVEVMSGSQMYQVRFDSDRKDARQINTGSNERNRSSRPPGSSGWSGAPQGTVAGPAGVIRKASGVSGSSKKGVSGSSSKATKMRKILDDLEELEQME